MTEESPITNRPQSLEKSTSLLQHPKQPWHKPTVTFIALQKTAFEGGTPTDNGTSGTSSGG